MISNAFQLSYFQQFMAHNTLKGKDGTGCCVCQILMDLNCEMDITAFEHAWSKTVLQHEQLRLGFVKKKDELYQSITDCDETSITYHDWSDSKPPKNDEWIETFLKSDRRLGFFTLQSTSFQADAVQVVKPEIPIPVQLSQRDCRIPVCPLNPAIFVRFLPVSRLRYHPPMLVSKAGRELVHWEKTIWKQNFSGKHTSINRVHHRRCQVPETKRHQRAITEARWP